MASTKHPKITTRKVSPLAFLHKPYSWLAIPILTVVLYANTLTHDYTQDDAIVIYQNMYTTQGLAGIPALLSYDTFRGFFKTEGKAKLVSGGRYRPLTPVMFAVGHELYGPNPLIGHLFNVLYYALLGWLMYIVLCRLLQPHLTSDTAIGVALITALLYIAHPIHTEAVANIKGRDEIIAMLCSLASCYTGLRYLDSSKVKWLLLTTLAFFLGLMSKENTITFLAVWPLAIFLFQKPLLKRSMLPWASMMLATVVFLSIRTAVLGFDLGGTPMELMNNPFLKLEDGRYIPMDWGEKYATIIYTLGKYLQLLVVPHPLTHDYYPRHIEMMTFASAKVWTSVAAYLALGLLFVWSVSRKPVIAFGVGLFIITLSIVSNIVFPIGTNMSERFMFMPSLGYTLILGYLLLVILTRWLSPNIVLGMTAFILLAYSAKTISRNTVWSDDYTLFTTDVNTSSRSAKVLNAAGGALTTTAYDLPDGPEKTEMLQQAVRYLTEALEIHPGYKNAALLLGNANYYLSNYDQAIKAYEQALRISPGYPDAEKNLAVVLRDAGKYAGEKEGNLSKAISYLEQSYQLRSDDIETIRLLGVSSGIRGDHQAAIKYFTKVAEAEPSKQAYENVARAYGNSGDSETAKKYFEKANTYQ